MMPRLRVFRSVCVALVASILVSGVAPAAAETHDNNTFSNTADSIINLLTSPATPAPAHRSSPTHARPQAARPKPVLAALPKSQAKPMIAARSKPLPKPVIAARPKPQAKPAITARARPQPMKAATVARAVTVPKVLSKAHVAPAQARPNVAAIPRPKALHVVAKAKPDAVRVVAMNARLKSARARKRKPYKPAHGGRGIAIVRPWQGSIPDTYCDLPTGCATAAPLAPEAATAGTASANAK